MNRQRGISLLSLLIGTLISVIVVVGMMMTYRTTIQAVVPASEAARRDGERISALLSAHMMLHDAGFGIDPADIDPNADLVVLNNALLIGQTLSGDIQSGTSRAGDSVVWGKRLDTNDDFEVDMSFCEGLLANDDGGLFRLSSNEVCDDASANWNTIEWTVTRLVDDAPAQLLGKDNDDKRVIQITIQNGECRPFGIGSINGDELRARGNIRVTLSYSRDTHTISSSTCLANFPPP